MIWIITIAFGCFLGAVGMVLWQVYQLRRGKVAVQPIDQLPLRLILIKAGDALALYVVAATRTGVRCAYIYFLLATRKIASWLKHQIGRTERYVSQIIHSARKNDQSNQQKSPTSLFLSEIKDHQDRIKQDLKNFYPRHRQGLK